MAVEQAWKIPPQSASEDAKLGWLREAVSEGEQYLQRQRSYSSLNRSIDTLMGRRRDRLSDKLSQTFVNWQKRYVREIVETLSNLRIIPAFSTDRTSQYAKHVTVLNKMFSAWYSMTHAERAIRQALQWAAAGGNGYISPIWEPDMWVTGRGDIALIPHGPRDVLPVQLGPEHDIQKAYAIIIRTEIPVGRAHNMWPTLADKLVATKNAPTLLGKFGRAARRFKSLALNVSRSGQAEEEEVISPVLDVYNCYVLDTSLNMSGHPIPMGDPDTSWYYTVPSLNSDIPTGSYTSTGQPVYRKATERDAMLYPMRRLMVATDHAVIYDGTSKWFHGKVPLIKFQLDDWPWEFLGFPVLHDTMPIQEGLTNLVRGMEDKANARLGVPLMFPETFAKSFMESFDPRIPNQHIPMDTGLGEKPSPLINAEYYDWPAQVMDFVRWQVSNMQYLIGLPDISALARARQIPSGDSMEKLMEAIGPLLQGMTHGIETSMRDFGEMWKCLAFQFYDLHRRVKVLGADGITEEDLDYEPGDMIPSHMPGEEGLAAMGRQSNFTLHERAKRHMQEFIFHVQKNSMHELNNMTRQLKYLQLFRSGFPIDPWTVAEALDIPLFGQPPSEANTVMAKWSAWLAALQQMGMSAPGLGPKGGHKGGGGRAPTGAASPTLSSKGDGRGLIKESR